MGDKNEPGAGVDQPGALHRVQYSSTRVLVPVASRISELLLIPSFTGNSLEL